MNAPFLERVYHRFSTIDVSEYCFVFPTRRAGYVFRQQYIKHQQQATWLPEILGIRDFILKVHAVPVADDLVLLLLLYQVLTSMGMQESLEKFIPWGKILLNDFNEIDQNLVNARRIYQQSYEERQIDQAFALSPEEMQEIAGFWKLFAKMPLSTLQENFLASWKLLPDVYDQFSQLLHQSGITYEGKAYREVAERITDKSIRLPWKKIVFCGFYALSNAEQSIFTQLTEQGLAETYWDSDNFYHDNPSHEAGLYLRRNDLLKENFSWKGNYFKEVPKNIYITGVPLRTGQVKWISELLDAKLNDPSFHPGNAVIVLPDENMLTSLLYALPEKLTSVNVTMGYPAKSSMTASLVNVFITLHKNAVTENGSYFLLRLMIKELLVKVSGKTPGLRLNAVLNSDTHPFIASGAVITEAGAAAFLLEEQQSLQQLHLTLKKLLKQYREKVSSTNAVELASCNHLLEELDHFFDLLKGKEKQLTVPVVLSLVEEHLHTLKIPFHSDADKGIQVMGFLETRTLDFDHVFILSVNENLLPASTSGKTYLPYSLRKAYKLPLRTEQDAVYSYHFYRLLQRAREVHLIYNTEPGSLSGGEISRYLLQISMELNTEKGYPVTVHHQAVSTDAVMQTVPDITIYKDAEVLQKLQDLYIEKKTGKGLSVTALSEYVHCSLKFYFKYIAGLRVPDEEAEELDAAMFGKVFHNAVSRIYEDTQTISSSDQLKLLAAIEPSLNEAVKREYGKVIHNGNDYLLKNVLKELLQRIVKHDVEESPVELIGHEKEYETTLHVDHAGTVQLYGKIDRIDSKDGILRIIDYKTGNDEVTDKYAIDQLFKDSKKKVMLQLLFYSWLVKRSAPHAAVKAGMYKLRHVSQGIKWMQKGEIITDEILDAFTSELSATISSLFNPTTPFSQATDRKRCEYCDFINLCGRKT
jgi:CRISPR/Cas system-associated exonuclease Cas4 (RecB family)